MCAYFVSVHRLTPAYAFMILIWSCLLYYTGDGPNWAYNKRFPTTLDPNCPNNWYLSLLYINNLFNSDKMVSSPNSNVYIHRAGSFC